MKRQQQNQQPAEFDVYLGALSHGESETIAHFFRGEGPRQAAPSREQERFCADFEQPPFWPHSRLGVPLEDGVGRLSSENLGGFYVRPPIL